MAECLTVDQDVAGSTPVSHPYFECVTSCWGIDPHRAASSISHPKREDCEESQSFYFRPLRIGTTESIEEEP
jgi:hypothetical protein